MKRILLIAALLLPTTALASDPSIAAKAMVDADMTAIVAHRLCGRAIGLPALYDTYQTIMLNDLLAGGKSRSDAVLIVDQVRTDAERRKDYIGDYDTCRQITSKASHDADVARALFKKAAGLD
ncbi:hypothetical protein LB533_20330 [Mesorhizobium sp. BR1-1-13]|uniref:hypothetical protein n=1 Tax=Mesorhizobium sp. BR1-1-13 TaxID=2876656 RepID=UPI001CD1353B|nr:hypothetical protein [Mesorhizobium sp. BR1-1-13]MBZ9943437.1 hypothetical protein [Mesorhizobium sp. BR1-1-13]